MSFVVMSRAAPTGRRGWLSPEGDGLDPRAVTRRVVIVEDELFVALHLESLVEGFGHEVLALASNGQDALEEIDAMGPDTVLLDVNLGQGLSGVDVAERLRGQGVNVVFITAYADETSRRRMAEAAPGCAILSKPVGEEALRRALDGAGPIAS